MRTGAGKQLTRPGIFLLELVMETRSSSVAGLGGVFWIGSLPDAKRQLAACGNQLLEEAIRHYAHLSRAMRLYPIADPAMLERVRSDHWAIIEALRAADRPRLRTLVVRHLEPSKQLYLAARAAIADLDPPRAAAS